MDRDQDIRKDRAHHEVDAIALEQTANLLNRDIGLKLIVSDNEFDVFPAHFTAEVFQRELETVFRLLTERDGEPDSV